MFVLTWTHRTLCFDLGPLHGNGDTVEEDNNKHHMVKHLVRDDFIAAHTNPVRYDQVRHFRIQSQHERMNTDYPIIM